MIPRLKQYRENVIPKLMELRDIKALCRSSCKKIILNLCLSLNHDRIR